MANAVAAGLSRQRIPTNPGYMEVAHVSAANLEQARESTGFDPAPRLLGPRQSALGELWKELPIPTRRVGDTFSEPEPRKDVDALVAWRAKADRDPLTLSLAEGERHAAGLIMPSICPVRHLEHAPGRVGPLAHASV